MNSVLRGNYVWWLFFSSTKRKKNHKNAQAQNDFTVPTSELGDFKKIKIPKTEDLKVHCSLWGEHAELLRYDFKIQCVFDSVFVTFTCTFVK